MDATLINLTKSQFQLVLEPPPADIELKKKRKALISGVIETLTARGIPREQVRSIVATRFKERFPAQSGPYLEALALRGTISIAGRVYQISSLTSLEIHGSRSLTSLPAAFGQLSSLTSLHISENNSLTSLPASFGQLSSLASLKISENNSLTSLPASFGQLSSLASLHISENNSLTSLPASFGELSSLASLHISENNSLTGLPASFGQLSRLASLHISENDSLTCLPASFGELSSLASLHISENDSLTSLPASFGELSSLTHLEIDKNRSLDLCKSITTGEVYDKKALIPNGGENHVSSVRNFLKAISEDKSADRLVRCRAYCDLGLIHCFPLQSGPAPIQDDPRDFVAARSAYQSAIVVGEECRPEHLSRCEMVRAHLGLAACAVHTDPINGWKIAAQQLGMALDATQMGDFSPSSAWTGHLPKPDEPRTQRTPKYCLPAQLNSKTDRPFFERHSPLGSFAPKTQPLVIPDDFGDAKRRINNDKGRLPVRFFSLDPAADPDAVPLPRDSFFSALVIALDGILVSVNRIPPGKSVREVPPDSVRVVRPRALDFLVALRRQCPTLEIVALSRLDRAESVSTVWFLEAAAGIPLFDAVGVLPPTLATVRLPALRRPRVILIDHSDVSAAVNPTACLMVPPFRAESKLSDATLMWLAQPMVRMFIIHWRIVAGSAPFGNEGDVGLPGVISNCLPRSLKDLRNAVASELVCGAPRWCSTRPRRPLIVSRIPDVSPPSGRYSPPLRDGLMARPEPAEYTCTCAELIHPHSPAFALFDHPFVVRYAAGGTAPAVRPYYLAVDAAYRAQLEENIKEFRKYCRDARSGKLQPPKCRRGVEPYAHSMRIDPVNHMTGFNSEDSDCTSQSVGWLQQMTGTETVTNLDELCEMLDMELTCEICSGSLFDGQELARLPCGHYCHYSQECLLDYAEQSVFKECPTCEEPFKFPTAPPAEPAVAPASDDDDDDDSSDSDSGGDSFRPMSVYNKWAADSF